MDLLRYEDYISEKMVLDLLLESKLVLSPKFNNILIRMKDDKIANHLISLNRKEVEDVKQNYIDITDDNDKASFTPDKKAQELNTNKDDIWKITESNRYLTHSDKNDKVFEALGYDKTANQNWAPDTGTLGLVLAETTRPSGRTYVLFQEYEYDEKPRLAVINKEAVEPSDDYENKAIWTTSRNPMNVGRLVRSILTTSKFEFTSKDIEDFVNKYKATYDLTKDVLKQFDIVKGKLIAKWYNGDNYTSGGGSLNNSCMSHVDEEYFDIYCYNDAVSLVILYDDTGSYDDTVKYKSSKIKGRALLWDCTIDGKEAIFMDRIYTTFDSDVELFKQFAQNNKWWYKKNQSMDQIEDITDGSFTKGNSTIVVKLNEATWDSYPYMDTLSYISTASDIATNMDNYGGVDRLLRDTEGGYDFIGDDEYYDEDDY